MDKEAAISVSLVFYCRQKGGRKWWANHLLAASLPWAHHASGNTDVLRWALRGDGQSQGIDVFLILTSYKNKFCPMACI